MWSYYFLHMSAANSLSHCLFYVVYFCLFLVLAQWEPQKKDLYLRGVTVCQAIGLTDLTVKNFQPNNLSWDLSIKWIRWAPEEPDRWDVHKIWRYTTPAKGSSKSTVKPDRPEATSLINYQNLIANFGNDSVLCPSKNYRQFKKYRVLSNSITTPTGTNATCIA